MAGGPRARGQRDTASGGPGKRASAKGSRDQQSPAAPHSERLAGFLGAERLVEELTRGVLGEPACLWTWNHAQHRGVAKMATPPSPGLTSHPAAAARDAGAAPTPSLSSSLSLSVYLSLSLSLSLSLCPSVSISCLCLSPSLSLSISLSVSVCISVYIHLSLSLSLSCLPPAPLPWGLPLRWCAPQCKLSPSHRVDRRFHRPGFPVELGLPGVGSLGMHSPRGIPPRDPATGRRTEPVRPHSLLPHRLAALDGGRCLGLPPALAPMAVANSEGRQS